MDLKDSKLNMSQLLDLAVENLQDACSDIVRIANNEEWLNFDSSATQDALDTVRNRFYLCFTLKNAFHDVITTKK